MCPTEAILKKDLVMSLTFKKDSIVSYYSYFLYVIRLSTDFWWFKQIPQKKKKNHLG